jgi:hypothetical protein
LFAHEKIEIEKQMEGKQYKIIVTDENIVGAIGLAAYFGVTNSQSNNESRSTDGTDSNPVIPLSPDSNSSTSTPDRIPRAALLTT